MKFTTQFRIGQRVKVKGGGSFVIGQIRILTLTDFLVLIEYRAEYSTGRNGPWRVENILEAVS